MLMPPIRARPVSGRYSGAADRFAIELRVDVDGARPTRRVSADYFRDGRYHGSMRVDRPHISFDQDAVTVTGKAPQLEYRLVPPSRRGHGMERLSRQ